MNRTRPARHASGVEQRVEAVQRVGGGGADGATLCVRARVVAKHADGAREGLRVGADGSSSQRARAYMLDTRNEEKNTVFYSCLACFVNTVTLHIYVSISYTGLARGPDAYVARCAPKRTVCCRRRLDMEPGCESGSRLKVLRVPK